MWIRKLVNRKKKWNLNRQNPRVEDRVGEEEGGGGVGDGALGAGDHYGGDHRPLVIWVVFSVVV